MHSDGKQRAAFPTMASIRDARGPDRQIRIRILKDTFKEAS